MSKDNYRRSRVERLILDLREELRRGFEDGELSEKLRADFVLRSKTPGRAIEVHFYTKPRDGTFSGSEMRIDMDSNAGPQDAA